MHRDRRCKGLTVRWTWLSSSTLLLPRWATSGTSILLSEPPFPQPSKEVSKRKQPPHLFYCADAKIHDIPKKPTHSDTEILLSSSKTFWPWNICPFTTRENTGKYATEMVKEKSQLCWACMKREGRSRLFFTGLRIKVDEVWESIQEWTVL